MENLIKQLQEHVEHFRETYAELRRNEMTNLRKAQELEAEAIKYRNLHTQYHELRENEYGKLSAMERALELAQRENS